MRSIERFLRRTCGGALLLAAILSLAACDGAGEPEDQPDTGSPSAAPSGSTTNPSATSPPMTPDTSTTPTTSLPTPARGEVTLRGVIQPGVEPGCLLLDGEGGPYLLLGGQQVLQAGAEVVVRGRVEPDTMTICQQGVPLMVTEAHPAK